ncbi:acetylcholinesterase [Hortaea werneckii]|nr:acetylcholinesterase [Hortaea werneckii]KAI7502407.1 acetylcholinesterase [Hortaea werneckii]
MATALSLLLLLSGAVNAFPPWHHGPPKWGHIEQDYRVSTTSGHVRGKVDPNLPNVQQYLGIPFAVPPVGDRRWTAPELLDQREAEIDATELPVSCMQYLSNQGSSVYVREIFEFNLQGLNRTGAVSEDCLTVSVWTPNSVDDRHGWHDEHHWGPPKAHGSKEETEGLPVLIFFYGGGFQTGGEDVPYQIPAQWVNRTPDHLVVSFNYRLNIFGFPNAAGLDEQNLGLLDQRAAVEWCKKNIAAFGGNPDRMVIWGQSAGSISVDYYNYAHYEDPLVTGLIMDSGTAYSDITSDDVSQSNFTFVAENVGCDGLGSDSARQLACMRKVSADKIEGFVAKYQESGDIPAIGFNPIPDNKIVFENYTERAVAGKQAQVPAIVGTNTEDGVPFVPYHPSGPDNQTAVLAALLRTFFCPATETLKYRQQTGLSSYRYLYAGNFSNVSPEPWMGAYHSSELPMLFGTHPNFRGPSTPLEYATSHAFQDAYVAFARDPEHGLAMQDWQQYSRLGEDTVREFGAGVAAQDTSIGSTEDLCAF